MGRILVFLALSLLPFTFLGMMWDAQTGNLLGYFLALVLISVLAYLQHSLFNLFIANLLSTICSYWLASAYLLAYGGYFKPLGVGGPLPLEAFLWLIPQLIVFLSFKRKRSQKLL